MKELTDIKNNGTPAGIVLLEADNMQEWKFAISVLGDETVYKVSLPHFLCWERITAGGGGEARRWQVAIVLIFWLCAA